MLMVTAVAMNVSAQDLVNTGNGKVTNKGVIKFVENTGAFKNDAPHANITNNVIEFQGTSNVFTDVADNPSGTTALGNVPEWRVPGLVRYTRPADAQRVQGRYYTRLELADAAPKTVADKTYVSDTYRIENSGDRTYEGIFGYDGTSPQELTSESGLGGTNRYRHLQLLNGPKRVDGAAIVHMSNEFFSDAQSPLRNEGIMRWGTSSQEYGGIDIAGGGQLFTGTGQSDLFANVTVFRGNLVMPDGAGLAIVHDGAVLLVRDDAAARLALGVQTQLDVVGGFRNDHGPLSNTSFHPSSLVNYISTRPQVMQATAADHPYGNLRTARSAKTASGDVYLASSLSVNDENVTMVPYTMSMTRGTASYTSLAEVVGAMRRVFDNPANEPTRRFTYNNAQTFVEFDDFPRALTLDVRPATDPNAFDPTTDIRRKVTVTNDGAWRAGVRIGYKVSDMPTQWAAGAGEALLKMYNAYAPPDNRALKLSPTVPPTYSRVPLAQSDGLAYLELRGLADSGLDNARVDNGNDILLRGARDILRAITSGRWSNPNTWDEGREPEPLDRVIIDGFTVHAGYVRTIDNYVVREKYPDSMATSVLLGTTPNTALVFGSEGTFNAFSLVPNERVTLTTNRVAPGIVPMGTMDTGSNPIDGGLVVYPQSTFLAPNLVVGRNATVFNAGTLIVGVQP